MIAAELAGVTRRYGSVVAVDDVSFAVRPGETLALLGANGAGKTTSIALLLGLRRPDAGTASIFGRRPELAATRRAVGVTPQETVFPPTLRVIELLRLVAAHYERRVREEELLSRFGLASLATRQAGGLSGGERRRLAVALAFTGAPPLVVLDEPSAGLDADARRQTWSAIAEHTSRGGSVLLTTHHLEEADALATHVVVLERGRVVVNGEVTAVKRAAGLARVSFATPGPGVDLAELDAQFDGVTARVRIVARDPAAVVADLVGRGVPLRELEVRPATLEEAVAALRGAS
jgi:ABC-2 type transport system ATP-binding protein